MGHQILGIFPRRALKVSTRRRFTGTLRNFAHVTEQKPLKDLSTVYLSPKHQVFGSAVGRMLLD